MYGFTLVHLLVQNRCTKIIERVFQAIFNRARKLKEFCDRGYECVFSFLGTRMITSIKNINFVHMNFHSQLCIIKKISILSF